MDIVLEELSSNILRKLSKEEEIEILKKYKQDKNVSIDIIVESYYKLVKSIALKYINQGVDLEDLIQEGNLGLLKAIEDFNPDKKVCFSTYTTIKIKNKIQNYVMNHGRTIRIAKYQVQNLYKLKKVLNLLSIKLNREPTIKELAQELEISEQAIEKLLQFSQSTRSLNETVEFSNPDSADTLEKVIPDKNLSIEEQYEEKEKIEMIRKFLENSILTEREREVLKLKFWGGNGKTLSDPQIAKILGITKVRVGQLYKKAILKLRREPDIQILIENYADDPYFTSLTIKKAININNQKCF